MRIKTEFMSMRNDWSTWKKLIFINQASWRSRASVIRSRISFGPVTVKWRRDHLPTATKAFRVSSQPRQQALSDKSTRIPFGIRRVRAVHSRDVLFYQSRRWLPEQWTTTAHCRPDKSPICIFRAQRFFVKRFFAFRIRVPNVGSCRDKLFIRRFIELNCSIALSQLTAVHRLPCAIKVQSYSCFVSFFFFFIHFVLLSFVRLIGCCCRCYCCSSTFYCLRSMQLTINNDINVIVLHLAIKQRTAFIHFAVNSGTGFWGFWCELPVGNSSKWPITKGTLHSESARCAPVPFKASIIPTGNPEAIGNFRKATITLTALKCGTETPF